MNKQEKTKYSRSLQNNFWLIKRIWQYTPGYVIWMIIQGILWGIHHSIGVIYMKFLFEELGGTANFVEILQIILCYGIYMLVFYYVHYWYWYVYKPASKQKLHIKMHEILFRQAVDIDLCKYDEPEFYNDFIWAMDKAFEHTAGMMDDTERLINRCVAAATLTGVLFSVDKIVAVIIFAVAVFRLCMTFIVNRLQLERVKELNPLERKEEYIKRVFRLPDYAKELRLTEVQKPLMKEYDENVKKEIQVADRYGKKITNLQSLIFGTATAVENILIILVLYKIMVTGELGLGGFVVAMNASWNMSWALSDMVNRLMKYHEHGIFIEKMRAFLECKSKINDGPETAGALESLVIRNLKFSYGDEDENCALKSVNMEIKKGEKIAIVGYNGAGKTTFTKLLMRLYDPNEGGILYNGKNLKEYTLESLRSHMAAVFQDYRIFACSLAENVAGGACESETRAREALQKSTFLEKLSTLPMGLHTQLTREFDNSGTQLSGGEQQKVAIARAFYKDADLVILDEPSSALDPDAEYALNQAISQYAENKTVIFISHRLSTTRNVDRIYMFDGGRIVESGTHEELIRKNGKYAYMFNLQAEKYRS